MWLLAGMYVFFFLLLSFLLNFLSAAFMGMCEGTRRDEEEQEVHAYVDDVDDAKQFVPNHGKLTYAIVVDIRAGQRHSS
jgi:hypothetical protein